MRHIKAGTVCRGGGMTLSFAEQGNAEGPAMVLLHGYSDSWISFRPFMAALPTYFRVIALSLRGHGSSSKPPSGYTTRMLAEDVVTAMDVLGITEAIVVGHSMGSLVAQQIALAHPHRVSRLVLIGAFATLKGNKAVEALWRDEVSHLSDPVDPAFVREFQMSSLAGPVAADFLDSAVAESLRLPARVWRNVLHSLLAEDHSGRWYEIRAPTLIIWGDKDAFSDRAEQEHLASAIRSARLVVHGGVGHAPHWENPHRVAADVAAFADASHRDAA